MKALNSISNNLLKIGTYFKDARHFQIAYLASFLLIGIFVLGWDSELSKYLLIVSAALFTQAIGNGITKQKTSNLKSALITSLGLCLLLKSNSHFTALFAAVIAISSKFLIRYNGKHIFNPVNFGIIVTILVTQDAWISPGQWGNSLILLFVLGILGFLVLSKVDRLDAAFTFLLVFGGLQFVRSILYLGWSLDVLGHQLSSGTLALFTFFMITDPMTTPNHRMARMAWAAGIAVVSFLLGNYFYIYAAPIWVLFFSLPLVPVLDALFNAQKFEWQFSKPIFSNK